MRPSVIRVSRRLTAEGRSRRETACIVWRCWFCARAMPSSCLFIILRLYLHVPAALTPHGPSHRRDKLTDLMYCEQAVIHDSKSDCLLREPTFERSCATLTRQSILRRLNDHINKELCVPETEHKLTKRSVYNTYVSRTPRKSKDVSDDSSVRARSSSAVERLCGSPVGQYSKASQTSDKVRGGGRGPCR